MFKPIIRSQFVMKNRPVDMKNGADMKNRGRYVAVDMKNRPVDMKNRPDMKNRGCG